MAPSLVKSASVVSLDMSISNHISLGTQSALASHDATVVTANNPWDDDAPSHESSVFGTQAQNSKMRRTPSVLFDLIIKEETQKAVSCEHIEMNLIADSNREVDPNKVYHINTNREEADSYWDMPSDMDAQESAVSTGQIERLLVEDALRRIKAEMDQQPMVTDCHPNNSYWDWPSEPVLESEKKSAMIASIILDEAIREKLSIDHITNLETSSKSNTGPQVQSAPSQANISADYWCWNADGQEEKSEVVAPHVHDSTHPNHAYWNFPSESRDPKDLKKQLIDKILNEERIRNILSSDTIEQREANFHRSKQGNKKSTTFAPDSVLNSVPSNYWDFNPASEGLLSLKQELINKILQEERQRYILSTENIENNLRMDDDIIGTQSGMESSPTVESYWDW